MNPETQAIRDAQLAPYRNEQSESVNRFPTYNNTPKVNVNQLIHKMKILLNEVTALNVGNLNLSGGNAQQIVATQLDSKLSELYLLMKQIREEHKFMGRIIS